MGNMRALRTRIKSLKSTQQVTKSMKMVSAAKLRRVQNAFGRSKPFADKCSDILAEVVSDDSVREHPLLTERAVKKRICYVLFVGNRGLCGIYNQAVLRYLLEIAEADSRECFLVVCGRWGRESITKSGIPIKRWFNDIDDVPTSDIAREISCYLNELYLNGEADEIAMVYQEYGSVLMQTPVRKTLLPVAVRERNDGRKREFIFEPEKVSVLEQLISLYIDSTIYAVLLEAKTSEHAARMTAMTSASDNAEELIKVLLLKLNHARQAAITTEIAEISGGAAVLDKTRH